MILLSGTVIFLLLPSYLIMIIENWRYIDAVYYTFVTLFTIGFGDFVAGTGSKTRPTQFDSLFNLEPLLKVLRQI